MIHELFMYGVSIRVDTMGFSSPDPLARAQGTWKYEIRMPNKFSDQSGDIFLRP